MAAFALGLEELQGLVGLAGGERAITLVAGGLGFLPESIRLDHARSLDLLPSGHRDLLLGARRLDVLPTRGLDVLAARRLDVLRPRRLDVL
jgi:hypothetical protein